MWFRRRFERELDEELRFHLESQIADYIKAGMTPREARRRVMAEFGGVDRAKEECRELRPVALVTSFAQDVRYGLRMLRRNPGFAAVAVLCLAVGIGANTAVFSFVDGVWMRPMPVPRTSELVRLYSTSRESPEGGFSHPEYRDFCEHANSFSSLVTVDYRGSIFSTDAWREDMAMVEVVSDNFFRALGAPLAAGGGFSEERDAAPSVVISHKLFEKRFGADPRAVGKTLRMNGRQVTIAGVASAEFTGTRASVQTAAWIPARFFGDDLENRENHWVHLIGRLRPDVSLETANQEVSAVAANLARAYPKSNKGRGARVVSDSDVRLKNPGVMLLALVGAVLLLAIGNVAILLLARAETRRHETSIRLAIGAGRFRLVRQFLTESVLLASGGALFGCLVGGLLIRIIPSLLPAEVMQFGLQFRLDGRALWFTLAVSAASAVLFGTVPALLGAKADLTPGLKAPAQGRHSVRALAPRNFLVVLQVALSIGLVFMGVLLAATFRNASRADLGFERKPMLVLEVDRIYEANTAQHDLFIRELTENIRALPGVRNAAVAGRCPFAGSGGGRTEKLFVLDSRRPAPDVPPEVHVSVIGPGYFGAIGQRLLRGRDLDINDHHASRKIAIINETAARTFWPGEDPLGKRFQTGGKEGPVWEITGIAKDAKWLQPTEQPTPLLYFPITQLPPYGLALMVETQGPPLALMAPIRKRLLAMNRDLTILGTTTLDELIYTSLIVPRVAAQLTGLLAGIGLMLAVVGLYGVVSYFVNRRTRDIGVSIALGATRGIVLKQVLRHAGWLVGIGSVLGAGLALAAGGVLESVLFGVRARDPLMLATAVFVMLLAGLGASYIPALRATRVDPVIALRQE